MKMNTTAIGINRTSAAIQAGSAAITNDAAHGAAPALLPDPVAQLSSSADVVAQIAAMLIRSLREDRNAARNRSVAEELRMEREGAARIKKMHEKADAIRSEGFRTGVSQIGAGALAGGGAAMQLGSVGAAGAAGGPSAPKDLPALHKWGRVLEGSRDTSTGIGRLSATRQEARQTDLEADAEQHRVNADIAGKHQQQSDDEVRDARELLSKVTDFLRECNGARNNAHHQASSIRV